MARDDPEQPDIEALRIAREEARATLDGQLSTLDDIDEKAVSVFRLNVAIVGVLLSALSFAASSDVAVAAALINPWVGTGVALFVLSGAAAGLTYTAGGQHVGAGPAGLEAATDHSERAYRVWLVESYADWIRYNERSNVRTALLVTVSILGTVAGSLVLGVGVVAAFTGRVLLPALFSLTGLLALAGLADLPGQFRRLLEGPTEAGGAVAPRSLDTPMAGQRTVKGGDRGE